MAEGITARKRSFATSPGRVGEGKAASVVGSDKWVGEKGLIIGMTTFGKSGLPDELLMDDFGITPEKVAATIKAKLG